MPDLTFNVIALDRASQAFIRMGAAVERFERQLSKIDGKNVRVDLSAAERDVGLAGDRMGQTLKQTMSARIGRNPPIWTIVLGGLLAGAPALLAGASLLFGGIAAVAVAQNAKVQQAWSKLWTDIKTGFIADSSVLVGTATNMAVKFGESFQRLRPALQQIFADLGPQISLLTDGVIALAEGAMPGLVTAVSRAGPVFEGLKSALAATGLGVRDLFTNVSTGANAAGSTLVGVGDLVQRLLGFLGDLLAWGAQFAAGFMPTFNATFGAMLNVLSAVLRIIQPITGALGSLTGVLLTGVAAWKLFGLAGGAIAALGARLGPALATAAVGAGALTTKLTGSATAGEAVAVAGSKAEGALSKFGRALPIIGIALIAMDMAVQAMSAHVDEWAKAVLQGTMTMGEAARKAQDTDALAAGLLAWSGNMGASLMVTAASANALTVEYDKQRAAMTPLQLAQSDVLRLTNEYGMALKTSGEHSAAAVSLAGQLAAAQGRVTEEQRKVGEAFKTTNQKMAEQIELQFTLINASLGYEGALLNLESAEIRAKEALAAHGAKSLEYREAALGAKEANVRAAESLGQKVEADNAGLGAAEAHRLGVLAERDELQRLADKATGPVKEALLGMVRDLDAATGGQARGTTAAVIHGTTLLTLAGQMDGPARAALLRIVQGMSAEELQSLQSAAATRALGIDVTRLPNGRIIDINVRAAVAESIQKWASGTWRGASTFGLAQGGVLAPMDDGGVLRRFASGGLNPMSGARAQIVAPNTWRVIGDNVHYPEVFAPLDGSARSLNFLRYGVKQYGLDIAERNSADIRDVDWGDGNRILPMASGNIIGLASSGRIAGSLKSLEGHYSAVLAANARETTLHRLAQLMASMGGPVGAGPAAAINFARAQAGKPYIWGAVGPGGYDCCITGPVRVYGPDGARPIRDVKAGDQVFSYVDGKITVQTVNAAWRSATQPVFKVRTRNRAVTASANHPFMRMVEVADRTVHHEDAYWPGPPAERAGCGSRRNTTCAVSLCGAVVLAAEMCVKHYGRWREHGDPRTFVTTGKRYDVEWARLDELHRGDLLVQPRAMGIEADPDPRLPDDTPVTEDVAWLLGAIVGDGTVGDRAVRLCLYGDERDRAAATICQHWACRPMYGQNYGLIASNTSLARTLSSIGMRRLGPDKRVPDAVWTWPVAQRRAFLDGYCDADGYRPKDPKRHGERTYSSASRELIEDVRALHIMLCDPVSNISTHHRTKPIVIKGRLVRNARPLHTLTIWPLTTKRGEVALRTHSLGRSAWLDSGDFTVTKVLEISDDGVQDTYDLEVDGAHNFIADGIVVHNSGYMSAILNVIQGRAPYARRFSTASIAGSGAMRPGSGGVFTIGSTPNAGGGIGHMAGTLGGLGNVEATPPRVRIGPGARGSSNSLFRQHFFIDTGGMLSHGSFGQNMSGHPERVLSPRQTAAFEALVGAITRPVRGADEWQSVVGAINGLRSDVNRLRAVQINNTFAGHDDRPLSNEVMEAQRLQADMGLFG